LTFLIIPQLERQGADIQTKVEELEITEVEGIIRGSENVVDAGLKFISNAKIVALALNQ